MYRDVEGGGGLVEDQQLRLDGDGARDAHSGLLAARKLVREAGQQRGAAGRSCRPAPRRGAVRAAPDRLLEAAQADRRWRRNGREARIERIAGILEDHLDAACGWCSPAKPLAQIAARSVSPRRMLPAVGSSRRLIRRTSVDLPQPESPPARPSRPCQWRSSPRRPRTAIVCRRPRSAWPAGRFRAESLTAGSSRRRRGARRRPVRQRPGAQRPTMRSQRPL